MNPFLSCDWGTSSFRLSLVDPADFKVLAHETAGKGILSTYNNWKDIHNGDPATRLSFYLDIINTYIGSLEKKAARSLDGIPVLVSGMASSSIGMKPLSYQQLPFAVDGSDMLAELLAPVPAFNHELLLVSGVSSGDDVMRGEETQLIGVASDDAQFTGDQLFIFPGTHSKHVVIKDNHAVAFKTFMTGEFFDLLSKTSILQDSVEPTGAWQNEQEKNSFEEAVREGAGSNLLHACFRVRTNILFDRFSKKENYHYLSGLLIGAELREMVQTDTGGIYLCAGSALKMYYETALQVLALNDKVYSFPSAVVDKAALKGQYKIYEKHANR